MRIPNWNKCHRANEDCPKIPRSCGQHDVSTIAAEKNTQNITLEEHKAKEKENKEKEKKENWGEKENRGGKEKRKRLKMPFLSPMGHGFS